MIIIGILASGRGSNFEAIHESILKNYISSARIGVVISDNENASVLKKAEIANIPFRYVDPTLFNRTRYYEHIVSVLKERRVNLVCLAGFMRIVKKPLLDAFPDRVLNIHPSLLPAFPGLDAQKQAFDYGVPLTGCTVHFVDEGMDTGPVIAQKVVPVKMYDTLPDLTTRILYAEHKLYPYVIKLIEQNKLKLKGRRVIQIENDVKLPG